MINNVDLTGYLLIWDTVSIWRVILGGMKFGTGL